MQKAEKRLCASIHFIDSPPTFDEATKRFLNFDKNKAICMTVSKKKLGGISAAL